MVRVLLFSFLFLSTTTLSVVRTFNVDLREREYLFDPDPQAENKTSTREGVDNDTHGGEDNHHDDNEGDKNSTSIGLSNSKPRYFGATIEYCKTTTHFVVSSAGNGDSQGRVFACGSHDDGHDHSDGKMCKNISPTPDMTQGQPLNSPSVGVSPDDGSITACLPLMEKKCDGHITSLGFCFRRPNDTSPWGMVQDKECTPPPEKVNFMFTIDGSSSLGEKNFNETRDWIREISKHLNFTFTNVGVVQYSKYTSTKVDIPLGKYKTHDEFEAVVKKMVYQKGKATFTGRAVELTVEELEKEAGENSEKIMLLLTDGRASDVFELEKRLVEMKNSGVTCIAVGVGDSVNDEEIEMIASSPSHVFHTSSFEDLASVVDPILVTVTQLRGEGSSESTELRMSQQGFSSVKIPNGRLVLGAVGAYDWSGTVAKYDSSTDKQADIPDYAEVQKVLVNRTKESYLGYAVTTGRYNDVTLDYVASGAPRYYMRGAVVVYRPVDDSKEFNDHNTILPHETHQQFGSYFGGTLLSMDVNGDGVDELFVAAPLYIGSNSDEGRVFVYTTSAQHQPNNVAKWASRDYLPIELSGARESGARFGTAMADAGDLNKDGYNDVIIGAPLSQDGKGAVYVYHGSADGITSAYTQRIGASEVQGANLLYFGQSLQGGVDLDGNLYPDVAVGAPRSDTIAIFRSRPVATFVQSLEFQHSEVDIFECLDQVEKQCQNITTCLTVSGVGVEDTLTVDMKIELDLADKGRLLYRPRADSSNGQLSITRENVTVSRDVRECTSYVLYVKDNIEDYNKEVVARVEYKLTADHLAKPLSSTSDPKVLNTDTSSMRFKKRCSGGSGKIVCEYDLNLTSQLLLPSSALQIREVGKSGSIVKDLTDGGNRLVIGKETSKQTVEVRVNMTNLQQDAFDAQLNVMFSSQLSWNELTDVVSSNPNHANCMKDRRDDLSGGSFKLQSYSKKVVQYEYDERRGNIMPSRAWCAFTMKFTWDKLRDYGDIEAVNITITADTVNTNEDSRDVDVSNNQRQHQIPLVYRADVDVKRKSSESVHQFNLTTADNFTVNSVQQIGPKQRDVVVQYEISGRGFSNVPTSNVVLTYPDKLTDNLYLLYLFDYTCQVVPFSGALRKASCECEEVNVNRLNLEFSGGNPNNTYSNTTVRPNHKPFTLNNIDCHNATTANKFCSSFACKLTNVGESDKVNFFARFRVWTPTFNFVKNDTMETKMTMKFEYETSQSKLLVNKQGGDVITYTSQYEVKAVKYIAPIKIVEKNQIWIYIVAGIGGLLLFLIAVLILYKCGFFKSKYAEKKEQLEWEEADNNDEEAREEET